VKGAEDSLAGLLAVAALAQEPAATGVNFYSLPLVHDASPR